VKIVKRKSSMIIRESNPEDLEWILEAIKKEWGSTIIITRGKIYEISKLPCLIAIFKNRRSGILAYKIDNKECEIISLNALIQGKGIGTSLLKAVEKIARDRKCEKLVVITTNDNIDALRFYQTRGFRIRAIHVNKIKEYREIKPEIPLKGFHDIEIRDEIELEKKLR